MAYDSTIEVADLDQEYWRLPIKQFLQNTSAGAEKRIQKIALQYMLLNGDLYKKSLEVGLLSSNVLARMSPCKLWEKCILEYVVPIKLE